MCEKIRCGCFCFNWLKVSCFLLRAAVLQLQTKTSLAAHSLWNCFRSLPLLRSRSIGVFPLRHMGEAGKFKRGSSQGPSTTMTSAPKSARIIVARPPAGPRVRSRILIPPSAFVKGLPSTMTTVSNEKIATFSRNAKILFRIGMYFMISAML